MSTLPDKPTSSWPAILALVIVLTGVGTYATSVAMTMSALSDDEEDRTRSSKVEERFNRQFNQGALD